MVERAETDPGYKCLFVWSGSVPSRRQRPDTYRLANESYTNNQHKREKINKFFITGNLNAASCSN